MSTPRRYYPVRIANDGGYLTKGGSGNWYVYDSVKGEIPVWVGHTTKRSAQGIADERNARDAPAGPSPRGRPVTIGAFISRIAEV